jgi:hypothetical protein
MTKVICAECGHENELERTYCHRCGARLEGSVASRRPEQKSLEETQRHVRKLVKPQKAKLRPLFFLFSKLILSACVAAAIIQMILPPEVLPAAKGEPPQINLDLENAIFSHRPTQVQYTEDQANAYLAYALKGKQAVLNKPLLAFKRAMLEFGESTVTITAERSLFGYSLYTRSAYAVQVAEGKIVVSNKGGGIGRLPFPPVIMQALDIVFADLWSALLRERKLIAKMSGIEFHDKKVLLSAPQH